MMDQQARLKLSRLLEQLKGNQSRRRFAAQLGVSDLTVRWWEEGKKEPSLANHKKIAAMAGYKSFDEYEAFLSGESSELSSETSLAEEAINLVRRLNIQDSKRVAEAAWEVAWQQLTALADQLSNREDSETQVRVLEYWHSQESEANSGDASSLKAIPLYSSAIAAGFPSPADDHLDMHLDLNEYLVQHPSATFYVRVDGDSMIEAGIHSGDLLVVDRALEATDRKIVVVAFDGELTVKRLCFLEGRPYLMPENPNYSPLPVGEENNCHIWGVVTNVIHPV